MYPFGIKPLEPLGTAFALYQGGFFDMPGFTIFGGITMLRQLPKSSYYKAQAVGSEGKVVDTGRLPRW